MTIFQNTVRCRLTEGMAVLDVGSGRSPVLSREDLAGIERYAGLDVSAAELLAAPPTAYSETHVVDVTTRIDELLDAFDLIVSRQVLEHVSDLAAALETMRSYLRPGGHLVAILSGTLSVQAVLSRVIPGWLGVRLMHDLLGREPEGVFRAHYDHCYHRALTKRLEPWSAAELTPFYLGGAYFNFSSLLRQAYFAYENWAFRTARTNLATHYLIVARR